MARDAGRCRIGGRYFRALRAEATGLRLPEDAGCAGLEDLPVFAAGLRDGAFALLGLVAERAAGFAPARGAEAFFAFAAVAFFVAVAAALPAGFAVFFAFRAGFDMNGCAAVRLAVSVADGDAA